MSNVAGTLDFADVLIWSEDVLDAMGMAAQECCRRRSERPDLVHVMPRCRDGYFVISISHEDLSDDEAHKRRFAEVKKRGLIG